MTLTSQTTGVLTDGAVPVRYWKLASGEREIVEGGIIEESALTIYVNGQELATVMCSPLDHDALALGFLANEGLITTRDDVRLLHGNATQTMVDVFLHSTQPVALRRIVLTSGCGGGVTFNDLYRERPALDTDFATTPQTLIARMKDLHQTAQLFPQVRGVHTAVLATPDRIVLSAEDIGRHNTIDKLAGKALQQEIDTRDHIMMSTGRISSEMLNKAHRMGVPLIVSRTSPTSATLTLAEAWRMCVVGYLQGTRLRVYTHPQRLGLPPL